MATNNAITKMSYELGMKNFFGQMAIAKSYLSNGLVTLSTIEGFTTEQANRITENIRNVTDFISFICSAEGAFNADIVAQNNEISEAAKGLASVE